MPLTENPEHIATPNRRSVTPTTFRRGVLYSGVGSVLNIAALFIETIIAARVLSENSYGNYLILVAVVNFAMLIADLGGKTSATRLIASSDESTQAILAQTGFTLRLFVIAALTLLFAIGQSLFVFFSAELMSYLIFFPIMVAVSSFDELLFGMLQGFHAYAAMSRSQVIRSVLRLVLTTALLTVFNLGAQALIYSWIISYALSAAYEYLALPIRIRLIWNRSALTDLLRFGYPHLLSRFLWLLFNQLHILLLSTFLGSGAVAAYGVAARIPDALYRLADSFIAVYFPTMASIISKGNANHAGAMIQQVLRLTSFATALVVLCAIMFNELIIAVFFSEKYAHVGGVFSLLMLSFHMTFIVSILGYTLTAAGFPKRCLVENVFRTSLTVLGDLVLIPVVGLSGPGYATLISTYASNFLAVRLLRGTGISVTVSPYIKQTAFLLLFTALYGYFQPYDFLPKALILILFCALNLGLSSITRQDLLIVLRPQRVN